MSPGIRPISSKTCGDNLESAARVLRAAFQARNCATTLKTERPKVEV